MNCYDVEVRRYFLGLCLCVCVNPCLEENSPIYLSLIARFHFDLVQKQGAHGHMDGMGQRRPIHDAVKTYLRQFSRTFKCTVQTFC